MRCNLSCRAVRVPGTLASRLTCISSPTHISVGAMSLDPPPASPSSSSCPSPRGKILASSFLSPDTHTPTYPLPLILHHLLKHRASHAVCVPGMAVGAAGCTSQAYKAVSDWERKARRDLVSAKPPCLPFRAQPEAVGSGPRQCTYLRALRVPWPRGCGRGGCLVGSVCDFF